MLTSNLLTKTIDLKAVLHIFKFEGPKICLILNVNHY